MNDSRYSRNWLFISKELQKKISKTKVLCCGTGMGSYVAELLVRTGFETLVIADGDNVDLSNLNRQAFSSQDIGRNKALACSKNLRKINPSLTLNPIPKFLARSHLEKLVPEVDIVVNTIDFDSDAFISCSNLCRKFNKIELFPTNLGFSGTVLYCPPKSPTFEEYFKTQNRADLKLEILKHLIDSSPSYLRDAFVEYKKNKKAYDPQLGISSFLTSALLVTTLLKIINNDAVGEFPTVLSVDCWDLKG